MARWMTALLALLLDRGDRLYPVPGVACLPVSQCSVVSHRRSLSSSLFSPGGLTNCPHQSTGATASQQQVQEVLTVKDPYLPQILGLLAAGMTSTALAVSGYLHQPETVRFWARSSPIKPPIAKFRCP
jgi:hypothetical protein